MISRTLEKTSLDEYLFVESNIHLLLQNGITHGNDTVYKIYGSKSRIKMENQHVFQFKIPEFAQQKYALVNNSQPFEKLIDIFFNKVWFKYRIGLNMYKFLYHSDAILRGIDVLPVEVEYSIYDWIIYMKYIAPVFYVWEYETAYSWRVKQKINNKLLKWNIEITNDSIKYIKSPVIHILLLPIIPHMKTYFDDPNNLLCLYLDQLLDVL